MSAGVGFDIVDEHFPVVQRATCIRFAAQKELQAALSRQLPGLVFIANDDASRERPVAQTQQPLHALLIGIALALAGSYELSHPSPRVSTGRTWQAVASPAPPSQANRASQ